MPTSEDWEWEMPIYQVEEINELDGSWIHTNVDLFTEDPTIFTGGEFFTAKRCIILEMFD